jgi:hypothetical protein
MMDGWMDGWIVGPWNDGEALSVHSVHENFRK